jgi:hypothetical protein
VKRKDRSNFSTSSIINSVSPVLFSEKKDHFEALFCLAKSFSLNTVIDVKKKKKKKKKVRMFDINK